jgi:hypothetical protein
MSLGDQPPAEFKAMVTKTNGSVENPSAVILQ